MPRPSLLLALALTLAARPAAAETRLSFRVDRFANEFWLLDQLSEWETGEPGPYRKAFAARFQLDDARRQALGRYAAVRRARAHPPSGEPDLAFPFDMLPPEPRPEEDFAVAFLSAKDEASACAALKLEPAQQQAVLAAFAAFRKDLDAWLDESSWLQQAATRLQAASAQARTGEYLDQMKAFYGVKDDAPYVVHVLWAPARYGKATVWNHEVVLPLPREQVEKAKELPSWLGVVVHELGHAYLARVGPARRAALSNRIVASHGVLNLRHGNVIDEATQTALGNIVFVRDRLPQSFDRRSFYSYEPRADFPDAIDSLARALEPAVTEALARHQPFDAYLERALQLQGELFPDAPRLHARVALLYLTDKGTRSTFDGLFQGLSRYSYDSPSEFAAASAKAPLISRWALLRADQLGPAAAALGMKPLTAIKLGPGQAGCALAARRGPGAGYDVAVVGQDPDALRRLLIALHRAQALPEAAPLCVPVAR